MSHDITQECNYPDDEPPTDANAVQKNNETSSPDVHGKQELIDIVEKAKNNDFEAFCTLIVPFKNYIRKIIWTNGNFDNQTIDDIYQEVIIATYCSLKNLRNLSLFTSWLKSIVSNISKQRLAKDTRENVAISEYSHILKIIFAEKNEKNQPDYEIEIEECKTKANEILAELPDDLREVFKLFYVLNESYTEVANQLKISTKKVKAKLRKAENLVAKHRDRMSVVVLLLFNDYPKTIASAAIDTINGKHNHTEEIIVAGGVLSHIYSSLLAPLLFIGWVLGVIGGVFACGISVVKNAPSVQLKRWHIINNFILYNLLFIAPVTILCVGACLPLKIKPTYYAFFLFFLGAGILCYIIYSLMSFQNVKKHTYTVSFEKLQKIINYGVIIDTACIIIALTTGIYGSWLKNADIQASFLIYSVAILAYQFFAYNQFKYLLNLCEKQYADQSDASPSPTNRTAEYWLIIAAMLFVAGPCIGHILTKCTHPIMSSYEIVVYLSLWYLVIIANNKYNGNRYKRIALMCVFQIITRILLLQFVYFPNQ
ncbi:MAG: RNA polymerase sigma factor [Thermoguttaceae bacterium]